MKIKTKAQILGLVICFWVVNSQASQAVIPRSALVVIESYISNYCQYAGDLQFEQSSIVSFQVGIVPGYSEAFKIVTVFLDLSYGDDDRLQSFSQELVLDNLQGNYRIKQASGPCETVIRHD